MATQSVIAKLRSVEPRRTTPILAGLVVVGFLAVSLVGDFRAHPALYLVGISVCFGLVWAWCSQAREGGVSLATLLGVGIVIRAFFLPLPPSLSDDVYRYVWDGKVVLAGENPYALKPNADALVSLRGPIWEQTAHRDVATVYPPLALGLFSISAALPDPVLGYKIVLSLLDLLGCVALWQLARDRGIPSSTVAWYAWNPLVVVEGAGMGHVDVAGIAFVIVAIGLLDRLQRAERVFGATGAPASDERAAEVAGREPRRGGERPLAVVADGARDTAFAAVVAAAGVLTKLVPIVALPLWIRWVRRRALFGGVLLGLLVTIAAGAVVWTGGMPSGLVEYGVSWEFNGPLFEPLWRAIGRLGGAELIKACLDLAKDVTGMHDLAAPLYSLAYPQLIAKAILALGILILIVRSCWERDLVAGSGRLVLRVLLCSATFYPWYLVWALPFAALLGSRPVLLLAWSIQLAYLPALFGVRYFPWVYLAVWAPFGLAVVVDCLLGRSRPAIVRSAIGRGVA